MIDRAWGLFPRTLPAGPALPQEGPRTLWDLWPGFLAALCLSWLLVCLGELGGPWGHTALFQPAMGRSRYSLLLLFSFPSPSSLPFLEAVAYGTTLCKPLDVLGFPRQVSSKSVLC